jgi:basic amino acid/polyamine antiporter, APA family
MANTLQRTLTLRDLVLIVVGTVIGSGIFIVPATVLRATGGDIGPALLVWLAAGVLSLLGALTYGELGARDPEAGGLYVYIRDAFGPLPAFLYGWTLFFVIGSGSVATLAVASTAYLSELVPIGAGTARCVAIAMIALVAAINIRGTRQSAHVQDGPRWSRPGRSC